MSNIANKIKKMHPISTLVFIKHNNLGYATIENNVRVNTFNHDEVIYRVKSVNTGEIYHYNSCHFKK